MKLQHRIAEFLFRNIYWLYRPLYYFFKSRSDAGEIKIIERHVQPGNTVLDIGANIGFYARLLSELAGKSGKVHCFEPDTLNFSKLSATCKNLHNVIIHNKAVSDINGKSKLYLSGSLNVDHRSYEPEKYTKIVEIESVSIDAMIPEGTSVDFIKMDIQGFEHRALSGMKRTLSQSSGIRMLSEFWPYGLKRSGASAIIYFEGLAALGFRCYLLGTNGPELLNAARVRDMENLGEEHYFNIFVTRSHV